MIALVSWLPAVVDSSLCKHGLIKKFKRKSCDIDVHNGFEKLWQISRNLAGLTFAQDYGQFGPTYMLKKDLRYT